MTENKSMDAVILENNILREENELLDKRVSGICKIYTVLRPVLKFLKFFSFVKKGAKGIIDTAIAVLDEACSIK